MDSYYDLVYYLVTYSNPNQVVLVTVILQLPESFYLPKACGLSARTGGQTMV